MMSPLEIAAVIASALGVWLTTQRKLSSWPVLLIACLLYALVFHREKLYSDMLLQFVFGAFAIYGWWHWQQGIRAEGTVRVEHLGWSGLTAGIVVGAAGSAVLGTLMAHFTDAALPHIDASLTSFSLVAQFWSTRKHLANWWLWIVVDVIYTWVFVYKHLYLTAVLYAFFVFLAVVGLRAWQIAYRHQNGVPAKPTPASASNAAARGLFE
jgi:nicotinamide mononucleotide transporter